MVLPCSMQAGCPSLLRYLNSNGVLFIKYFHNLLLYIWGMLQGFQKLKIGGEQLSVFVVRMQNVITPGALKMSELICSCVML